MAYTPEQSYRGSASLRRLAWFRGKPMSKTLEALLEATGETMAEIRCQKHPHALQVNLITMTSNEENRKPFQLRGGYYLKG